MNQQRSTRRRRRMRMVAGAAVAVLALGGLTACEDTVPIGDGGSDSQGPDDDAGDADAGDDADAGEGDAGEGDGGPAEADDGFLGAGETQVYDNGVEITLGAAEEFEPSEYVDHAGMPYKVTVTVTNNGDADFSADLLVTARAGDDGVEADRIFDSAELGDTPRGTVKPGRTITGTIGFDVPEGADFLDVQTRVVGDRDLEPAFWNLRL